MLSSNKCTQKEVLLNSRKSTKETDSLFCIIEYNPTNPPIQEWIRVLLPVLYRSSGTRSLTDQDLVFHYRKPKGLQDIFVPTNSFGNSNKKKQTPKCNGKKSRHCPHIDKTGEVTSSSTGRKYRSMLNVTCNSSNLIYLIECTICKIQYVGQIKNKILGRMNKHYSSIKNRLETLVTKHFTAHTIEGFYPI